MKIQLAHSPDADDAFMFYPLLEGKIDTGDFQFLDVQADIETLNQKAHEGAYEVTALSFHAYPGVSDQYFLLSTGACFGEKYGPIVISSKPLKPRQLLKVKVGIPGKKTSAFLALKLYEHHLAGEAKSGICYSVIPFDQIMDQLTAGKIDAGLLIHEGQVSYEEKGFFKIVDLGMWWHQETKLPLPLGGIVVRRDLPHEVCGEMERLIRESIRYSLEHKEEALQKALPFSRGLDPEKASQFIGMYVNDLTLDFGRQGLKAIRKFLEEGYRVGLIDGPTIKIEECVWKNSPIRFQAFPSSGEISPAIPPSSIPSLDEKKDGQ